MQDILSLLPVNMDAIGLSLAGGIATLLVFILRALFSMARKFAERTPTVIDDKIVDETKKALKEKSKDI
jgi:hypothetical protein